MNVFHPVTKMLTIFGHRWTQRYLIVVCWRYFQLSWRILYFCL